MTQVLARVLCMLMVCTLGLGTCVAAPNVAPPVSKQPAPGAARNPAKLPVYAKIVIDSLYCQKESKWDHGTSQDEPYVMVTGFATHRNPKAWVLDDPEVFGEVDSGNNRRFTKQNTVVFEGEVPRDAAIGFQAVLWERDNSPEDTRQKIHQQLCRRINEHIMKCINEGYAVAGPGGSFIATLYGAFPSLVAAILEQWGSVLTGGGDDKVADAAVAFTYDDIAAWAAQEPFQKASQLELKGGEDGHYWLRYHIEFQPDATQKLDVKFTEWDDIATGDVSGDRRDEFVIASEGDGSNGNGRLCVYNSDGRLARSFDVLYSRFDRVAVGNLEGGRNAQIVLASPKDGGLVRTYDAMGSPRDRFNIPFTKYDGFAVADVVGDEKAEIIVARQGEKKILVYSGNGTKIDEFGLNWTFRGARYTGSDTRHDAFLAGDVAGDAKAEIVTIENKDGGSSILRVYDGRGSEVRTSIVLNTIGAGFYHYSAAALGDIQGDAKKELILSTPEDNGSETDTIYIIDVANGKRVGIRRGWFAKYDGFAAGSLVYPGKAHIILASRADGKLHLIR